MRIRDITRFDYAAVDRLLLQLQQADAAGRPDLFSPADHYMSREAFDSLLENDNILAFLALERLEPVGCCFASLLERNGPPLVKIAYIDLLVVDAQHRRRGIGKALFQEVQERARKVGSDRVELMVWSHNKIAERAYESYGMTPQRSIYEIRLNG